MVLIKHLDGRTSTGYAAAGGLGQGEILDLLTPEGEHQAIGLSSIKTVNFVHNFDDSGEIGRKAFLSRPKLPGVWVRMVFRDGDTLEGVMNNDLMESLNNGVQAAPPDSTANCHRVFVPKSALAGVTVLGVVGAGRPVLRAHRAPPAREVQRKLFGEPE